MATTSHTVSLLPNFGAEEGLEWPDGIQGSSVRTGARLWRSLFGSSARILSMEDDACEPLLTASEPVLDWLPLADAGVAWLPTVASHGRLRRLGGDVWGPDPEIVRRTHDKAFARSVVHQLGIDASPSENLFAILDPADFSEIGALTAQIHQALSDWPEWARRSWTLKPRFGSAGRGRVPGFGYDIHSPQLEGSLPRFAERGGAILEPFLDRTLDLSAQFCIHSPTEIELLGTMRQDLTVSGSYLGHQGRLADGAITAATPFDDELVRTSRMLVEAAARKGLIGPCGVDAFAYRLGDETYFRPGVELNARFTVGTVVIGLIRRLLQKSESLQSFTRLPLDWRFQLDGQVGPTTTSADESTCCFTFGMAHLRFETCSRI